MTVADIIRDHPKPLALHTDEDVLALAAPAASAGNDACPALKHWQIVLLLLTSAVEFCGAPAALFARGVMPKRKKYEAFCFLRAIETMLRRILLILAARDARPLAPMSLKRTSAAFAAESISRTDGQAGPNEGAADEPAKDSPIYFALTPPAPKLRVPPAPRDLSPFRSWGACDMPEKSDNAPACNLARRLEAAIRVFEDPDVYVLRLRRKLAARESRATVLYTRILITPAGPWVDLLAAAMAEACGDAYDAIRILCERPPPIVAG